MKRNKSQQCRSEFTHLLMKTETLSLFLPIHLWKPTSFLAVVANSGSAVESREELSKCQRCDQVLQLIIRYLDDGDLLQNQKSAQGLALGASQFTFVDIVHCHIHVKPEKTLRIIPPKTNSLNIFAHSNRAS